MEDGRTSGEIASLLKAPRSCVAEWLRNYETHGTDGLLEGHRSGRPTSLTELQRIELADFIESGPIAYGFTGGVWTGPMVARVIEDEFGVHFSAFHVRRILHTMGFSVQRPKRVLARADPEQQDRWRRYVYPNIKKKPAPLEPPSSSKTKRASDKTRRSTRRGRESATNR
jgi:transposase